MLASFLCPLTAIICRASKPDYQGLWQLSPWLNGLCFSFSRQVYAQMDHHFRKWRRFSLGSEIKSRSRDLSDLDTARRKPQDNILDQVFHSSNVHRNLRHLPGGLLLTHPLLCKSSVLRCCPGWIKNQTILPSSMAKVQHYLRNKSLSGPFGPKSVLSIRTMFSKIFLFAYRWLLINFCQHSAIYFRSLFVEFTSFKFFRLTTMWQTP